MTLATSSSPIVRKYYVPDDVNFTPGERSFVAWVSTEQVDHEGDVVVARGVDFTSVFMGAEPGQGNPVVMAIHDYGEWPVGKCEWMKVKTTPEWTGLFAKTLMDEDGEAELVWKKIRAGTVKGTSIGFVPPEGMSRAEWGPPTPEDLRKHPEWKGAARIIRRCVLIEYSIVPIPMNPTSLIVAVAKGLHKPVYVAKELPVDNPTPEPQESVTEPASDPETVPIEQPEPVEPAETKAMDADVEDDEDADEGGADEGPIRNGHFVKVVKGSYKGMVGKVKSIHRGEMVPDVEDDVMGTKENPAARVKCYKAIGDGHKETDQHIGVHVKNVERIEDLKPPKKKGKSIAPGLSLDDLPPLVGKSDEELREERLAAQKAAITPEVIKQAVGMALDKITGVI